MVGHLPGMHEALGLIPGKPPAKQKYNERPRPTSHVLHRVLGGSGSYQETAAALELSPGF